MTRDQLWRFIDGAILDELALREFIDCAKEDVEPIDENLVIGTALCCSEELWKSSAIQQMIQNSAFENYNVGLICQLLGSEAVKSDLLFKLHELIKKDGAKLARADLLFRLITLLHERKKINAKQILLPRLGWFSKIEMWENVIMTFRICELSLLLDKKLMFIPMIRSARCRALLKILSADLAVKASASLAPLRRGVSMLERLKSEDHTSVVMRISLVSMFERRKLASDLIHEMTATGDRRDLQYLEAAAKLELTSTRQP